MKVKICDVCNRTFCDDEREQHKNCAILFKGFRKQSKQRKAQPNLNREMIEGPEAAQRFMDALKIALSVRGKIA